MIEEIKEKLKEIEENVYYGAGRFADRNTWDCIVFGKRRTRIAPAQKSTAKRWFVAIVKEEFIPDGTEEKVIQAMRSIGMKLADEDILYDYLEKSGECMVEICTIAFVIPEKRC